VSHVVSGGAVGLSPAGSTGEGARLSCQERARVTAAVRELAPPAMPIVAGAPVANAAAGVAEIAALNDAGADAALVSVQAIYPLSDNDVSRLYETLAESSPVPIVLYNIPVYTGVRLPVELVARLARHPNVAGIKDSSRDMEYLQQVVTATADADFRVFTGTDTLLVASLALGVHGTIAASVNLVPELAVGICRAFAANDLAGARVLQKRLTRVVLACRRGPAPAGWKAALAIRGICGAALVPPGAALDESSRDELAAILTDLGVIAGDAA
jgi:dihydrodipicolinate synthase/N-acetylneuraminate lyase